MWAHQNPSNGLFQTELGVGANWQILLFILMGAVNEAVPIQTRGGSENKYAAAPWWKVEAEKTF